MNQRESSGPAKFPPFFVRQAAFTLVELLAVIFIISLLIGILLPSISGARNQAKNLKIKATQKVIGDGLEMFRTENEKEFRATNGYPRSDFDDDPAESGSDKLSGAHWLVRYLLGKDLQGFVARKSVPPSLQSTPPGGDDEQVDWYKPDATTSGPLQRQATYVNPDTIETEVTSQIPGYSAIAGDFGSGGKTGNQSLILDVYGHPILYYAANPLVQTTMARVDASDPTENATYTQLDNAPITGSDMGASYAGWNFGAGDHKIKPFGDITDGTTISAKPDSFCWYILDKKTYGATSTGSGGIQDASLRATNPKGYLLISAGIDSIYGTSDDITNFER